MVEWTSQASAEQRAGRAGRTSAGVCYRLYSSAVFNDEFKKYSDPEITTKPIEDLLLQMKAIGIDNVANFPFPSSPHIESLLSAEKKLLMLEALEEHVIHKRNKKIHLTKITQLGKRMANFPVNPRYSKMLCLSNQHNLLPFTITIICSLTVQEIFSLENSENAGKSKNIFFSNPSCLILGDLMVILCAVGAANHTSISEKFCAHYGLRYNAMVEINKLRFQMSKKLKELFKNFDGSSAVLNPPDHAQIKLLRQLFLCAFVDHVARKTPFMDVAETDQNGNVVKKSKPARNCYQSIEVEAPVFVSPHSVLYNENVEYVAYHDMFESDGRLIIRNLVAIEPHWLPIYGSKFCTFSKPLAEPPPRYDAVEDKVKCYRESTFGPYSWKIPAVELDYPDGEDKYRQVAFFLLKGDIFKWFVKYVPVLTLSPSFLTKSWAYIQPKVDKVVQALIRNRIDNKRTLADKWKVDSACKFFGEIEYKPC